MKTTAPILIALTLTVALVALVAGIAAADDVWYKAGHLHEFIADRDACAAAAGIAVLNETLWRNGTITHSQKAA